MVVDLIRDMTMKTERGGWVYFGDESIALYETMNLVQRLLEFLGMKGNLHDGPSSSPPPCSHILCDCLLTTPELVWMTNGIWWK
jgi:hypothetical protein